MNSDFRQRILIPVLLPFVTLLAILGVAFSFSRVLLAVPSVVAALLALGLAAYVLAVAFLIERRPRISSRALGVGLALGLVGIAGAGVAAAAAGPRPEEAHEEGEEGTGGGTGEDGAVDEVPEGAVVWAGGANIEYTEVPEGPIPAGTITVALRNEGLPHNVTFEGVNGDAPIVQADNAGIYVDEVTLEPGEYTYYCSIAGHRANMQGTITVE